MSSSGSDVRRADYSSIKIRGNANAHIGESHQKENYDSNHTNLSIFNILGAIRVHSVALHVLVNHQSIMGSASTYNRSET